MHLVLTLALLLSTGGNAQWTVDGWLLSHTEESCSVTKRINSSVGTFTVQLVQGSAGRYLSVYNKSWVGPKTRRLPYIALKGGRTVLSEDALATSGASFGNGIIFQLRTTREILVGIFSANPLTVWDAREPKKLFSLSLSPAREALEQWASCGDKLERSKRTDPFQ